jgi:hypothetical protein
MPVRTSGCVSATADTPRPPAQSPSCVVFAARRYHLVTTSDGGEVGNGNGSFGRCVACLRRPGAPDRYRRTRRRVGEPALRAGTCYFGPWTMRHEKADQLWDGDPIAVLESLTSFPRDGPLKLPLVTWIAEQLKQPSYMQVSGSVCRFRDFLRIRDGRPRKKDPCASQCLPPRHRASGSWLNSARP